MRKLTKLPNVLIAILMIFASMIAFTACLNGSEDEGPRKYAVTLEGKEDEGPRKYTVTLEGKEAELTIDGNNAQLTIQTENTAAILKRLGLDDDDLDFTFTEISGYKGTCEEDEDGTVTARFSNLLEGYVSGGNDAPKVKEALVKDMRETIDPSDEEGSKVLETRIDAIENDKLLDHEETVLEIEAVFKVDKKAKTAIIISMANQYGFKSITRYYENGNPESSIFYYDESENIESETEYYENGNKKFYVVYDENGNVDRKTIYEYYENGKEKSHITYDGNGNKVTEFDYNENGDPTYCLYYDEDGNAHNSMVYEYYENGKLKSRSSYDESENVDGKHIYEYHDNGNLKHEIIFGRNEIKVTEFDYNENGDPTYYIHYDGNGKKEREEYYENGKLKSVILYDENENKSAEFEYYENGKPKSEILYDENGNINKTEYDENGKRIDNRLGR